MKKVTDSEFCKNTSNYLNKVLDGESTLITHCHKTIALLRPINTPDRKKSFQRSALRLKLKGVCLSKAVIADRKDRDFF